MFLLASLLRSSDIATAALTANERRLLRSAHADVTAMADTPQALAIAARLHRLVEPPQQAAGRNGATHTTPHTGLAKNQD